MNGLPEVLRQILKRLVLLTIPAEQQLYIQKDADAERSPENLHKSHREGLGVIGSLLL